MLIETKMVLVKGAVEQKYYCIYRMKDGFTDIMKEVMHTNGFY